MRLALFHLVPANLLVSINQSIITPAVTKDDSFRTSRRKNIRQNKRGQDDKSANNPKTTNTPNKLPKRRWTYQDSASTSAHSPISNSLLALSLIDLSAPAPATSRTRSLIERLIMDIGRSFSMNFFIATTETTANPLEWHFVVGDGLFVVEGGEGLWWKREKKKKSWCLGTSGERFVGCYSEFMVSGSGGPRVWRGWGLFFGQ